MEKRIVLASNNPGKIREIQAIFSHLRIVPQSEFGAPEAEEHAHTFVENAIIKARNAASYCNLPAIADDSGIEVDALWGKPGVRSARFAGPAASDRENLEKLLRLIEGIPEDRRGARFVCVMVYLRHAEDPMPLIATGVWNGRILDQARGLNGFGYDPIFWVPESQCSSAQLAPEQKNRISHRAIALRKLASLLSNSQG